ncbi:hypothetical protein N7471_001772 [Penicillium samsonianum]|uniref:uncharacterized protein n=1 Tax=Penicillium samsonianum TaxID=1882272 RepID=UPI00254895CC|nr:uncharacterized protein N7471_001772 [Penicillium samsonianum]KAJ6150573.1 hypothetical protein N7471_001772 [Penicillium samsonianum]
MTAGACYWSGRSSYCCPCRGQVLPDVVESSSTYCLECGHPLRNHFRIGPHPSDPSASQVLLPRHQTVKKLANRIHELRVVLARGTPSSGKTFLARSLHTYLRGQGVKSIYIRSFPLSLEGGPTALHHLVEACHIQGFATFGHSVLRDKFVFLIDDAHTTYNNSELWLILNSVNQDRLGNIPGASFCMFSAFGTPDRGVMPHNMGSDLLIFNKSQRLFLSERSAEDITLFYTREEFDLYMEMHFQGRGSDYEICDILKDMIFGLTDGQPELMDAFMHLCDMWYEAFYKDDDLDLMSYDDYEISQFFQTRGILEGTIAVIVNFVGLPLLPETFFLLNMSLRFFARLTKPVMTAFYSTHKVKLCYHASQKVGFTWKRADKEDSNVTFQQCFTTGLWNTSWESRILGIPPRLL